MHSWDAWDTLIARRSLTDIHNEDDNVFPIAENVAQVQPDDIIVSDYYDESLLKNLILDVTALGNRVIVTEDGKRSGHIWPTLPGVSHHTGDNPECDVTSPQKCGIKATLTTLSPFTKNESMLATAFPALARTMREARLTTYDPQFRPFELLQTQVNFPLLFVASVLLHRQVGRRKDVLMSSRDCCLWSSLQEKVRDLARGDYRVHYFLTSRIARLKASPAYIKYTNALLGERPLVVDLCGYGRTLPPLLAKTNHPDADIYLLAKYDDPDRSRRTRVKSFAPGNSWIERANLAQHAMVVDVKDNWSPVYLNPANVDWEHIPEIQASHRAFRKALEVMKHYDFSKELGVSDGILTQVLNTLLAQLSLPEWRPVLNFRGDRLLLDEEPAILAELRQLESTPPPVATPVTMLTRLHCEMPYFGQLAAADGLTPQILNRLRRDDRACVGSNSERMARDFESIVGKPCFYLPSTYDLPPAPSRRVTPSGVDNVACFGRVFCLKNITVQAIAALRFAKARKHRLCFHINEFAQDEGKAIVAALKMLFDNQSNGALILHKWYPHQTLLRVLGEMTIGLQVSLTEASNVISLDMVAAGLPVVVSPEVKWAARSVYPTNSEAIAEEMLYTMAHPELAQENRHNIAVHNANCFMHWQRFLGPNARVLFLVHTALNTGITTVAANDCAMLRANGIPADVVPTTFAPDAVRRAINEKKPTHVVSEASWSPHNV